SNCIEPMAAIEYHKQALWSAEASRHDEAAVLALLSMSHLSINLRDDVTGPRDWIELAGAILQRMSPAPPALQAWRLANLGFIATGEGKVDQALDYLKQTLALQERMLGTGHL